MSDVSFTGFKIQVCRAVYFWRLLGRIHCLSSFYRLSSSQSPIPPLRLALSFNSTPSSSLSLDEPKDNADL